MKNTYLRTDGRWESRIYFGKSDNGTRKYKAFFGHSREEAENKRAEYLRTISVTSQTDVTFMTAAHDWLDSLRLPPSR